MGHDRSNRECPVRKMGNCLTKTMWDRLHSVMKLSLPLSDVCVDPVVPSDTKGLKIHGCVDFPSVNSDVTQVFKASVLVKGVERKVGPTCWVSKMAIDSWGRLGASNVHFVFI